MTPPQITLYECLITWLALLICFLRPEKAMILVLLLGGLLERRLLLEMTRLWWKEWWSLCFLLRTRLHWTAEPVPPAFSLHLLPPPRRRHYFLPYYNTRVIWWRHSEQLLLLYTPTTTDQDLSLRRKIYSYNSSTYNHTRIIQSINIPEEYIMLNIRYFVVYFHRELINRVKFRGVIKSSCVDLNRHIWDIKAFMV